jgi:cardiolipin synthase
VEAAPTLPAAVEMIAVELPRSQVMAIVSALVGFDQATLLARSSCDSAAPTTKARSLIGRLFSSWRADPTMPGRAVAGMLEAASGAAERLRSQQQLSLVWTGPPTGHVPVRATAMALLDLITEATEELLLVSFAAYKVPAVVQALIEATERGVKVRLVLDSSSEGSLDVDAKRAFAALGGLATFYTWPLSKRPLHPNGHPAALHAKCAIADQSRALVGSANLTGAALNINMELGVEIRRGTLPHRLASHFDGLITSGQLRRIGATSGTAAEAP